MGLLGGVFALGCGTMSTSPPPESRPLRWGILSTGRIAGGIAERAEKTVQNSVVAMTLITPAVLMLAVANISTAGTILAIQLFLSARIAYAICFIFGITFLRTLSWIVGFAASAYLYLCLI